jgi:4-aminobutyrate aminotransferase/(S)-3-amino-2-methylpropionate transaminase
VTDNADFLARRAAAVPRGVSTAAPIFIERAENAELWDVEGRRYIDFAGGIAVLNVGHRNPKVMAAVNAQLERYTHLAFQVTAYEPYIVLAERLNALAPFEGPAKTIFFTTGAEAVENTIKIARAATGRSAVIAFTGAFHGRTMLSMALTGKVSPYKKQFGPSAPEIYHLPFPAPHLGVSVEDSLKALSYLFAADADPSRVAAIILEPVQGEGGFNLAPPELLRALREICDEHGIVLIADEVQTGFARTGKMFGIEHSGVEPDLMAVAKSMAGGFPLSGVIGRKELMDFVEPGGLGGTYSGSPVACAAALAVLDVIEEENLLGRADAIGARIRSRVARLAERNDIVAIDALRGPGAMIGFDIVKSRGGGEPDGATAKRVTSLALAEGLVLLNAGVHGQTIRILVPLTASDELVDEGLDCMERALVAATS